MKSSLILVINFILFIGFLKEISIQTKFSQGRLLENQTIIQVTKTAKEPLPTLKSTLENSLSTRKKTQISTPLSTSMVPEIPPADPNLARIIIGAGILIVLVVILGVWINRNHLR